MKVLIVSEHEPARDWVRGALGPGFIAVEAANGLEARELAESEDVDVVITDQTAEPFGGLGLAREIKMNIEEPPPVIVLLDRAQDTWLAKWSGAERWFVRPIDPFALAQAARELTGEAPATVTIGLASRTASGDGVATAGPEAGQAGTGVTNELDTPSAVAEPPPGT